MTTTITFLGLLILTNLSPSGGDIVMGVVPGVSPVHDQIIAYPPDAFVSQNNWPKAGMVVINDVAYDYVRIDRETITFSGPTNQFVNAVEDAIHLSCCCPTMQGLRPEYRDKDQPTDTKAAAHIVLDHGQLQGFAFDTGALGFVLAYDKTDQALTINGVLGSTSRQLVLKAGSSIIIANSSLAALSGFGTAHSTDFVSYYNMGITSALCNLKPGDAGGPCHQAADPCTSTSSAVHRPKLNAAQQDLVKRVRARIAGCCTAVVDINCSGSAWP